MSNIEIAQKAEMHRIIKTGSKLGLSGDALIQYGLHKVKLSNEYIKENIESLFYGKW